MDFPKLIKACRLRLGETQERFAKRFKSHANTVSRWESGSYEAPYKVLEFVLLFDRPVAVCKQCDGGGVIYGGKANKYPTIAQVRQSDKAALRPKKVSR